MALRKLTDAIAEPLTLDEAKTHLNIFEPSRDGYIGAIITAARQTCEGKLQRTLIQTDWELTLDTFPCAIPLRMPRVQSVASVKYIDAGGSLQTLAPSAYYVDDRSEPGWIVPAYGTIWPMTLNQVNAVTVVYRCGYGADSSAVPEPIRQWIRLMVGSMFDNRETEVATPGIVVAELGFAERLLDPYRIMEV